jgi:hypothetical protein
MEKNTVTKYDVDAILLKSSFRILSYNNKTTIVMATLPSGFVIVESSSCVDPANYDEKIGEDICLDRIKNKIWELEGYCLQKKVSENGES